MAALSKRLARLRARVRHTLSREHLAELFSTRSFKAGGYTVASCVAVIAISVAVVLAVQALPTSVTSIDISRDQTTSISDETRDFLAGLDQDITIYLICEEGQENEYLEVLLGKYESASNHIQVVQKDPVLYPSFTSQYTSEQLGDNSLILVCGEKSRVVSSSDLYTLNSSTYSYDFAGESAITSAITALTSEELPKVYLLTGHGEQDLPSAVADDVASANFETAELNLLSEGAVPSDADAVLMYAPQSDLSQEEAEVLLAYLEAGGSFMLVTDYDDEEMPNLANVMNSYGVEAVDGLVVEGDPSMRMAGYPYYLLPNVAVHDITSELSNEGGYALVPLAHGITELDQYRSSLEITLLLTTSDAAYVKTDAANAETLEQEEGDVAGKVALGVAISEEVSGSSEGSESSASDDDSGASDEDGSAETRVVWFSSSAFLDPSVDLRVGGNNSELFVSALAWLGHSDISTSTLASRGLGTSTLTIDSSVASALSVLGIGIVPAAFLAAGFWIWRARRVA